MQLVCTNIGCSVTLQRKGSFCMLIHGSCFGLFHLFVCLGDFLSIFEGELGFGWLVLFGCLFGVFFQEKISGTRNFIRDIILNSYADRGFYLASTELNNSVNCYCLPAGFEKCVSPTSLGLAAEG